MSQPWQYFVIIGGGVFEASTAWHLAYHRLPSSRCLSISFQAFAVFYISNIVPKNLCALRAFDQNGMVYIQSPLFKNTAETDAANNLGETFKDTGKDVRALVVKELNFDGSQHLQCSQASYNC
ncbi:hypothetical protein C8J56DRAFT_1030123 [Mycena floridula]|nr:hypothetical protein C8J56DRAFT_1030123 [Mycena floridula]